MVKTLFVGMVVANAVLLVTAFKGTGLRRSVIAGLSALVAVVLGGILLSLI